MMSAVAFSRVVAPRKAFNAPRRAASLRRARGAVRSSRVLTASRSPRAVPCQSNSAARSRTRLTQARAAMRSLSILPMVLMETSPSCRSSGKAGNRSVAKATQVRAIVLLRLDLRELDVFGPLNALAFHERVGPGDVPIARRRRHADLEQALMHLGQVQD